MTPKPATSVGQVFALIAGFLALAAIGAVLGWVLTNPSSPSLAGSGTSSAPVIETTSASPFPSVSPTPSPTPSGPVVPDFVTSGTNFIDARAELLADGVGVDLIFDGDGQEGDALVTQTQPAAGEPMPKGITVKIYVAGPAPQLNVPDETGTPCSSAGKDLAATGFKVGYGQNGKTGVVLSQDPDATDTDAHWNDKVTLTCGVAQTSPSANPSPSDSVMPGSGG